MFLGLDISQTDAAAILANERGETQIALRTLLPKAGGSPAIWLCAIDLAREAMQRAQIAPQHIRAVALSLDVPFDARGTILRGARTDGWEGFDVPKALREHLNVSRAVAKNRAFCASRGEARFGALRKSDASTRADAERQNTTSKSTFEPTGNENAGDQNPARESGAQADSNDNFSGASTRADENKISREENWLFVHLDWQLGAAACIDGKMLRGENNRALDLGAICIDRDGALGANGNRGSLEAYCGGESFMARAAGYGITVRSALDVWRMAPQNYAAQTLCDDFVRRLAQGVSVALSILDARRVVFGGALSESLGETLLVPLRVALSEFWRAPQEGASARGVVLEAAQLGRDAAVLGAIDCAIAASQRAD